jgi:hypothetical protein
MPSTCSFPGCDRVIPHGRFCRGHRPIRGIREGIFCQLCGFGPRASLNKHVIHFHEGCGPYQEQFGPESLESGTVRRNRHDTWESWIKGVAWDPPTKQKACAKGHRLAGGNVSIKRRGGHGSRKDELHRDCRKCHNERQRQKIRRNQPAWRRRWRKCRLCGESFIPIRKIQRYCCAKHQARARAKGGHQPRKCEGCHRKFTPRSGNQRFCSTECRPKVPWTPKSYVDRSCSICERSFSPSRSTHIVCSDDCRAEAGRRRAAAWTKRSST